MAHTLDTGSDVIPHGIGWKLFRRRRDGSLGPLFINPRQRIEPGQVYPAEAHPTKGYAYRPGWHLALEPHAPHLSTKGRVWARVRFTNGRRFARPQSQGGCWILADSLQVLEVRNA